MRNKYLSLTDLRSLFSENVIYDHKTNTEQTIFNLKFINQIMCQYRKANLLRVYTYRKNILYVHQSAKVHLREQKLLLNSSNCTCRICL